MRVWLYVCFLVCFGLAEARKHLSTPRKIKVEVTTPHSIEIKWRDPDLKGRGRLKTSRVYVVRYATDEIEKDKNGAGNFQTQKSRFRRVKLSGLEAGTTYAIRVKTVKGKRSSQWSKVTLVTTRAAKENPNVVRNLTATPLSSDSILVSWSPPTEANQAVAYTVLMQLANGKGRLKKAVVTGEMSSYKVKNLRPNLLYSFKVQTMQKIGPHPTSMSVRTKPFPDKPTGAPKSLRLEMVNSSLVMVRWQPPPLRSRNGQLIGYTVQYKRKGARKGDVCTITTNRGVRMYHLMDILGNETYRVRVAASSINGTGPYSKWASVFVEPSNDTDTVNRRHNKGENSDTSSDGTFPDLSPSPPSEVKVFNITGSSVHLVWPIPVTPECCPVVAYRISIRNVNDSGESEIVRGTAHVHLTGLDPETVYGVNVSTLNTAGESEPSVELRFTTPEALPPTITFLQATTVNVGGSANITCKAEGHDLPMIEWYIQEGDRNTIIDEIKESNPSFAETIAVMPQQDSHEKITSSLLLYKVTAAAEEVYICVAKNSVGSVEQKLLLHVNEPPRIIRRSGMNVMVGRPARLVCGAYGKPGPQIIWRHVQSGTIYKEDQVPYRKTPSTIKKPVYATSVSGGENSYIIQSILVIEKSSLSNAGAYVCEARSQSGRAEANIVLDVKVPSPPPVHKIQSIALSPKRVSVSWLPPLNYSYSIKFYQVSYRNASGEQPIVINTTRVGTELYDLKPNTDYYIAVTAGTDDSLGQAGPEVKVTTLTNEGLQPANVSAIALNSSIIQLDWEAPNNITPMYIRGYNVYYKREGEMLPEKLFVKGSRNKQFLIGLGKDDTYYLRISTLMTWGFEAFSAWITIQKRSDAFLPPSMPVNVTAVARHEEIVLFWDEAMMTQLGGHTDGSKVKGYAIEFIPVFTSAPIRTATVMPGVKKYVMAGLEPATEYEISIRAFNQIGQSEPVYLRSTTKAYPPSMVQNATAHAISSTEIHVQWEPPKRGNVTQYHIRYWRPGRKDKQSAKMTGSFRNYVAGSLRKNSNYRFEIIPYNEPLIGEGIVIFARTYSDKPDGPPLDVAIRPINSTALLATWSPPDPEKANGFIKAYKLILREKQGKRVARFRVDWRKTNYTFLNMKTSNEYKFRIAAMTVNGTGEFSPWVTNSFSIDPEKPDPPENLAVTATETTLTLRWEEPKFTGSAIRGYIVGHGQFIPEVYREIVSDSQKNFTIHYLKPNSEYIVSVRAFNLIGESPPAFKIARTNELPLLAKPLLPPVKLAVQSESHTSLRLTWIDPSLAEDQQARDDRAYTIRYSPIHGEAYSFLNTTLRHLILPDLEPATFYEVSVKVVRGNHSSTWSMPVVNSTQETAPSSPPKNISALPLEHYPNYIVLRWSKPDHSNGKIIEYIIYMTSHPTHDTKLWEVRTTDKLETRVTDIVPHTVYYFKLQARNRAGYGPLSDTVTYYPPTDKGAAPPSVTVHGLYGNMSTTVTVAWSRPKVLLSPITGYMVHYTDDVTKPNIDWLVHMERGLDSVVMGLEYNTTYYFKVQARYSAGFGPFSDVVSYTTPVDSDVNFDKNDDNIKKSQRQGKGDSSTANIDFKKAKSSGEDIYTNVKRQSQEDYNSEDHYQRSKEGQTEDKTRPYSSRDTSPPSYLQTTESERVSKNRSDIAHSGDRDRSIDTRGSIDSDEDDTISSRDFIMTDKYLNGSTSFDDEEDDIDDDGSADGADNADKETTHKAEQVKSNNSENDPLGEHDTEKDFNFQYRPTAHVDFQNGNDKISSEGVTDDTIKNKKRVEREQKSHRRKAWRAKLRSYGRE